MKSGEIRELYEKYGFLIYKRCLNILRSKNDAKDAMHEVFLKLVENYHRIEYPEHVVAWIYSTAKYHCFNTLRSSKKFVGEGYLETVSDPENLEERLSSAEIIRLVFQIKDRPLRIGVRNCKVPFTP